LRRQFPDSETKSQKSGAASDGDNKEIRDKLRRLLPSNIFVQILAGPPELRTGIFGSMLKLIARTTLVAFPVLVLLLLQIQFLPFHDVTITWAQRAALFLDILFLWLLRPPIFAYVSNESSDRSWFFSRPLWGFGLAGAMSIAAIWLSIIVATTSGEWQERWQKTVRVAWHRPRCQICAVEKFEVLSTHDFLFAGEVDKTTRRRKSLFSNTLVLPGFNLYEALKIDDPKKLAWKKHLFDFRARHLEQAVLDGADLTKADLYGAQLRGASLFAVQLQGALLDGAELQGASLDGAELLGASLFLANLQGASLIRAQLQGASLLEARLQGASLYGAVVNATDFSEAFLWRTDWGETDPAKLGAVRLDAALERWKPVWQKSIVSSLLPWDAKAYAELRVSMNSIPEGKMRDAALKRIETLDCGNSGKTLASCDPAPEVLAWQQKLLEANVDHAVYEEALPRVLRGLVCTSDANAIYILRGIIRSDRLAETDREAPALVDDIMSPKCPVSAALTNDDKAKLLEIKQRPEIEFPPPPTSKKDK
jgi:hypothetical protein